MINIAIKAAHEAGKIILQHRKQLTKIQVVEKAQHDFVTEVDQLAEQEIIQTINTAYPQHGFLAEESGGEKDHEYIWVIDPLDGTTNYIYGIPHFSVSIALWHKDKFEHAVIYDPLREELFTASHGKGAFLNGDSIQVSARKELQGSLLSTGFPFRELDHLPEYTQMFAKLLPQCAGVRRCGSAALDLAYIAAGRLDGFWEFGLYPWDLAAGVLLIKEAGGMISNFQGQENYLNHDNIIAGNPEIYNAILPIIQSCLSK
jgi:myo-inositol-1(or 4)-monophosphatase